MALNSPNLFEQNPLFSDDGRMLSESDAEGAGRNKTFIHRVGNVSSGIATIYTVPADKVLFITSAFIGCMSTHTTSVRYGDLVNPSGVSFLGATAGIAVANESSVGNNASSFPMPVKFTAGQLVRINSSDTSSAHGGFAGWLEDA